MDHLGTTDSAAQPESKQPTAIDIDLPCPHCDYNLRGLIEDRCPECGEPFDRQQLIKWETEWGVDLLFTRTPKAYQYNSLMHAVLFVPSRVGRELASGVDPEQARRYARQMRLIGILMLLVLSPLTTGQWHWVSFVLCLFVSPAIVLATVVCEELTSGVLIYFVEPIRCPVARTGGFWRSLCQCFSTHFPVTCFAVAVARVASEPFVFPVFLLCLGWWWACLSRAVLVRSGRSTGRIVALLCVPIIVCVSVVVGLALGLICSLMGACVLDALGES